jgi:hypothetical protein
VVARISEGELAGVYVDALIDDDVDLPERLPASPKSSGIPRKGGALRTKSPAQIAGQRTPRKRRSNCGRSSDAAGSVWRFELGRIAQFERATGTACGPLFF